MLPDGLDTSGGRQIWSYVPRRKFVDAVSQIIGNALDHVGEMRFGIEPVQAR